MDKIQQELFITETVIERIRKQVMKEFTRIDGESWDDYLEVIRDEVDRRLELLNPHHYNYKSK